MNYATTAEFMASPDYQVASKCEEWLDSKSVPLPEGLVGLDIAQAFHGFFTPEAVAEWDREAKEAEILEQAEGAWAEYCEEGKQYGEWKVEGIARDGKHWRADEIAELGAGTHIKHAKTNKGEHRLCISNPKLCEDVLDFLTEKRAKLIEEKKKSLMPKKNKAKGGQRPTRVKKDASEYDCQITNTPETAQGAEYEYFLSTTEEDDSEEVMLKDGKIKKGKGEDGKDLKPQTYKAVRKATPFLSNPEEGKCCAAVSWDRVKGSKVAGLFGVRGSFVMGCSCDATSDGRCEKHQGADSVFETKYKSGVLKGMPHAQFLYHLHECEQSCLEGEADWVKEQVGGNWVDRDFEEVMEAAEQADYKY